MKKILKNILDWLEPKVSYADLRFVQTEKESIEVENGILSSYNVSTSRGVGIRVLADGAWGFAASNNLNKISLRETAAKALDIARASAITKKEDVKLAYEDKHIDSYITPITKNPFQVSPAEKIDLLVKTTKMMIKDKVKKSEGSFSFYKTYKIFVSTEDSELEQTIFESGGGITAYAIGEGDFQKRSYPSSFGGDYATRGYEFIEEMNLLENAERISEEANQLLVAPPAHEGVPASKSFLVNKGKFVGYLMSREDAFKLGLPSNGAGRAENWNRIPLVRMTNINLLPGNLELEKLIGDIKEGLYLDYNKSWSIDDKRINFQFGTEIAREIKNGKLGKIYKNAVYQGITPEFWKSCDGISSEKYWHIWGVPNCGKGQPEQSMHVAHGTSPARFRKVKVGASK